MAVNMAEIAPNDNAPPADETSIAGSAGSDDGTESAQEWPTGWAYKKFNVYRWTFYFASPGFQLFMVSMVCFMCPGMFNALSGMGGGGKADATLADNMVSHARFKLH